MRISCPGCGEIYDNVPDEWAGQVARCEHCRKEFVVQANYSAATAPARLDEPANPAEPQFLIEVTCPLCKKSFDAPESASLSSYTCPECGNHFLSFTKTASKVVSFTCPHCHQQQTIAKERVLHPKGGVLCCMFCQAVYSDNCFFAIKIGAKLSRAASSPSSPPRTANSLNCQSAPRFFRSYLADPGIYILLALLFGSIGAHNLYAQENGKFLFKLIVSGLAIVFFIAAIVNQPSVKYDGYFATTHTPDAYPYYIFFLFLCAVINLIAIFADIINADANCKGHL